jgi:hypothetical protein
MSEGTQSKSTGGGGCLVTLLVAGVCIYGGYTLADNAGDVPHTKTVDLYMAGDWLVGENRTCSAIQGRDKASDPVSLGAIFCPSDAPSEHPHNVEIRFWGKVSRPELVLDTNSPRDSDWRCVRQSDEFTCYALD